MPRAVTITGTRTTTEISAADLDCAFASYLRPFACADVHFYLGGAAGIDTLALHWLASHTSAGLTVVVPRTVADQPPTATETIAHWRHRGRLADVVELRAPTLDTTAFHARNRWMVDHSAFVIGFPPGTRPAHGSGTRYTIEYAAEQGKPRLVVPL